MVKYNDSTYFYRKNAQNDIIAILDTNGAVVVKYKYDAWGVPIIEKDKQAAAKYHHARNLEQFLSENKSVL